MLRVCDDHLPSADFSINTQSASFSLEDFIRYNEEHYRASSDGGSGTNSDYSSSRSAEGCGPGQVPTSILLNARPIGPVCLAQTNKSSSDTVCVSRYVCISSKLCLARPAHVLFIRVPTNPPTHTKLFPPTYTLARYQ